MTLLPIYPNQGQQIALGWDQQPYLKNWTSYVGTDGERFLPPNDRNGYTDGIVRRLPTGVVFMTGLPIVKLTFPWMSSGQIDYLETTFNGQNVTVAVHRPTSITQFNTYVYNAVLNIDINQAVNLTRNRSGYNNFSVELVLVEPL